MERTLLSYIRQKKFWTLAEAAKRLGIKPSTLQRWEKGTSSPQPINLQRLCEVYEMTAEELGLADGPVEPTPPPDEEGLTVAQFQKQDLTLCLLRIVWQGRRHAVNNYSVLQSLIIQELDIHLDREEQEPFSHRDALRRLALLPIVMLGLSALGAVLTASAHDILVQCSAGIVACWQLRRGKDLAFASAVVRHYIPTLKALTQSAPARERKAAADVLAQCLLLKSTLARHVDGSYKAVIYAQQAAIYSESAENPILQALALRTQAAAHYYANHWDQALQAAEQAQAILEASRGPIPPIVRSHVYAGLATYQASNGQKQEALRSLGKAHRTFFAQPPDKTVPTWIDHNQANLILNDGMTHFHLGLQKEAIDSFGQIPLTPLRSELICVESFINQVMAEVNRPDAERDMEWCIDRWIQGIEGAKLLQSEQRFTEAVNIYTAMCAAWPGEQRIKELRAYITHW